MTMKQAIFNDSLGRALGNACTVKARQSTPTKDALQLSMELLSFSALIIIDD